MYTRMVQEQDADSQNPPQDKLQTTIVTETVVIAFSTYRYIRNIRIESEIKEQWNRVLKSMHAGNKLHV